MIADTVNIPYAPYSRQSCIFQSVAVSGECCPRTFQNGRQYTGTSPDEIKTVVLNSVLIRLS